MRPLRILLAGHFRPNMHYGIMQKLHHGFIRLGHTVLHFDDRLIARGSTPFLSRQFGLPAMNAAFIRGKKVVARKATDEMIEKASQQRAPRGPQMNHSSPRNRRFSSTRQAR